MVGSQVQEVVLHDEESILVLLHLEGLVPIREAVIEREDVEGVEVLLSLTHI